MTFRVSARTILQLGAELISSDGIAFYELIKNAFDAGSPNVNVDVVIRVPASQLAIVRLALDSAIARERRLESPGEPAGTAAWTRDERKKLQAEVERLRAALHNAADVTAPGSHELLAATAAAPTLTALGIVARDANQIVVRDRGHGMTLADLRDVYLTVGTPSRARERAAQSADDGRRITGEKGLGRLSVMRLGNHLRVVTATEADTCWNTLDIDWAAFGADDAAFVEDVPVAPARGEPKAVPGDRGTVLTISALSAAWTPERLRQIVEDEFSKLSDPFTPALRFPVAAAFNGARVESRRFDARLLDHAHATLTVRFDPGADGRSPALTGDMWYRPPQAERPRPFRRSLHLDGLHLFAASGDTTDAVLQALGPWTLNLYWYNRRHLTRMEGIGELGTIRKLIKQWAGGVMVFRDGFRVLPYGGPDDDWLGLDAKAFGSSGFKMNRQQIVAKLDVTSRGNPALRDQTNREGLRDNAEKAALVALLRTLLTGQFKPFLDEVDLQVRATGATTLDEVADRLATQDARLDRALHALLEAAPDVRQHPAVAEIQSAVAVMRELVSESRHIVETMEHGRGDLVHLASLGLTVDILAHELTRTATGALKTLADARRATTRTPGAQPDQAPPTFVPVLEAQLTTLAKRLRTLDPLSTAGRQRKERFNLGEWVRTILAFHENQFERHAIACGFSTTPESGDVEVSAVKGMVVQVIENLISNSVYWLDKRRKRGDTFRPTIDVRLDVTRGELRFTDNGPGITPDRQESVFLPFTTTKADGVGRGLGLYISREIAQYNGWALRLDNRASADGMLRTFVLEMPEDAP